MINLNSKKIFVCATEQSGENIGELIISNLKKELPSLEIDGIGGAKMKKFMNNQFFNLSDFHSIGIIEILTSLRKYINMINYLSKTVISQNYDLVITIDSPDFNYPLAKKIRKKGYNGKIIQIVAPTVWAWRKNRAKKYALVYDMIFTLFPFENKYFEKYNLPSICIGHPIFYIKSKDTQKNKKYIALLPGSRINEVKVLIKYFKLASDYLYSISSDYELFIPTLPHLKDEINKLILQWKNKPQLIIDQNKIQQLYSQTYIALVCSGTASLEIAKRNIPQLIIYKLNIFTELIISFFIKVKFANIFNIISNKMIIPELLNSKLNKVVFLSEFKKLLYNHHNINENQIDELQLYIKKIMFPDPPHKIALYEIKKLLF